MLHLAVLSTLLEISRAVTSTLELQPLLGRVLDQLRTIVESRNAAIMLVEGAIPAATDAATYVLNLAQAAIAEMRALIFELRPDSLQQEGLVAALERHATSAGARHALQVDARFGPEPDLSLETKEAVYRIAQEALHNVVKHAHAHKVSLRLEEVDGGVVLEVSDDGVGFEPTANYPGHFGLTSMRERAAARGGQLTITSAPGQGARRPSRSRRSSKSPPCAS